MKISPIQFYSLLFLTFSSQYSFSQKTWTLQDCIDYGLKNNLQLQQNTFFIQKDELAIQQNKLTFFPRASFNSNAGMQFGRSIDPTSNQFISSKILFSNQDISVENELFAWFRKKHQLEQSRLQYLFDNATNEKQKLEIIVQVIERYLNATMNIYQIDATKLKLLQSHEQYATIQKKVKVGALSEINLVDMQLQLSNDSLLYLSAINGYESSILQLKSSLNMNMGDSISIDTSANFFSLIEKSEIPNLSLSNNSYYSAIQQKINGFQIKIAEKTVQISRTAMYPTLSIFGGLNARYSNAQKYIPTEFTDINVPIGLVNIAGIDFTVTSQKQVPYLYDKNTFFKQLKNNFNQNIGVSFYVPIFNQGIAKRNWKSAQLDLKIQKTENEKIIAQIEHETNQLYVSIISAKDRYVVANSSFIIANKAYTMAQIKFEKGNLTPFELTISQNNLFKAQINLISTKFDYFLKLKIWELYTKGVEH